MRSSVLAGALALSVVGLAACGDDDSAVGGGTATTATTSPAPGSGASPGPDLDLCELVDRSDVESIVSAEATEPERISVEDRRPPLRGACAFSIQNPGVGGSFVNLLVTDELLFDLDRRNDDVEVVEVSDLGDDAFSFHGMNGPELQVRSGSTFFTVNIGSRDDRFGLTDASMRALAELVLSRL